MQHATTQNSVQQRGLLCFMGASIGSVQQAAGKKKQKKQQPPNAWNPVSNCSDQVHHMSPSLCMMLSWILLENLKEISSFPSFHPGDRGLKLPV